MMQTQIIIFLILCANVAISICLTYSFVVLLKFILSFNRKLFYVVLVKLISSQLLLVYWVYLIIAYIMCVILYTYSSFARTAAACFIIFSGKS